MASNVQPIHCKPGVRNKVGVEVWRLQKLVVELVVRLPFLLRHSLPLVQVEQLALEIVGYRAMMSVSGYVLVSVPEVASRFSEPPRVARAALRLLESRGIAKHTEFKDRWALR